MRECVGVSVCARERGTEEQREGDFKMVEIEGGRQNGQEDEEDTLPNEQEEVRAKASQRN